jgi:hypothetical protein
MIRETSERKRAANRANAQRSTGPKTVAGKARVSQNARRHGLSLKSVPEPGWSAEVDALACAIAGGETGDRHALACRIAAAQIDLMRVRQARAQLGDPAALVDAKLARRLASLARYEWRALARRKFAIRDFDAAGHFGQTNPPKAEVPHGGSAHGFGQTNPSEHDPEKWEPVFGKDHAQCKEEL